MNETGTGSTATVGAAPAGQFAAVEGKAQEEIPAVPFVGLAYGFIWIALLGYVLTVARGLGRVRQEMDDLKRKLDGG